MKNVIYYIGREVLLGAKDNLNGIKQMVLHPILSLKSFGSALWHPIKTLKGMWGLFTESPIRFLTNIVFSFAQGQVVGWSLQKLRGSNISNTSTAGQAAELICQLDNFTFANTSSLPVVSNSAPSRPLLFSGPIPGNFCAATRCGVPVAPVTAPTSMVTPCFIDFSDESSQTTRLKKKK